jgi:hypothetical protein
MRSRKPDPFATNIVYVRENGSVRRPEIHQNLHPGYGPRRRDQPPEGSAGVSQHSEEEREKNETLVSLGKHIAGADGWARVLMLASRSGLIDQDWGLGDLSWNRDRGDKHSGCARFSSIPSSLRRKRGLQREP